MAWSLMPVAYVFWKVSASEGVRILIDISKFTHKTNFSPARGHCIWFLDHANRLALVALERPNEKAGSTAWSDS